MTSDAFLHDALDIVTKTTGVKYSDLLARSQKRELVVARQLFCWAGVKELRRREDTDLSLTKIGQAINRDHSTVLYSSQKFSERCEIYEKDRLLAQEVNQRFREKQMKLYIQVEMKSKDISDEMLDFIGDIADKMVRVEFHVQKANMESWRRKRVNTYLSDVKRILSAYPDRRAVREIASEYLINRVYETEEM